MNYTPTEKFPYRWDDAPNGYEVLYGPEGEICYLGEPEDRSFGRDAAKIPALLNKLHAELCDLRTRLAAFERVAKAAESVVMQNYRGPEDYDELYAAIDAAKST